MAWNAMAGKLASESLVSCMHSTSGWAYDSHSSTLGMRAFRELTIHVAIRMTAPPYAPRHGSPRGRCRPSPDGYALAEGGARAPAGRALLPHDRGLLASGTRRCLARRTSGS